MDKGWDDRAIWLYILHDQIVPASHNNGRDERIGHISKNSRQRLPIRYTFEIVLYCGAT